MELDSASGALVGEDARDALIQPQPDQEGQDAGHAEDPHAASVDAKRQRLDASAAGSISPTLDRNTQASTEAAAAGDMSSPSAEAGVAATSSGEVPTPESNAHQPLRRWNDDDFLKGYGALSIHDSLGGVNQAALPPHLSANARDTSPSNSSSPASGSSGSYTSEGSPFPGDFRELGPLYPMLSRDERQRLAALFTLSSGLEEDDELMDHITLLAKLAPIATGYEIGLVGLVNNSHYMQLNTKRDGRKLVPRREAICAHTIANASKQTVHNFSNLDRDWRFEGNPQVHVHGMRSYAGTPLLYEVPELNISLPMGSLCVASLKPVSPLNDNQAAELQRIARSIMHAITSVARRNQLSRQTEMQKELMTLRMSASEPANASNVIQQALQKFFQTSKVTFQSAASQRIQLRGIDDVPFSSFQEHIWENDDLISYFIAEKNHVEWTEDSSSSTIRAMAFQSGEQYIVVETTDLRTFYDPNIDILFLNHCALLLANISQRVRLDAALNAKTAFLRDVQHSIRTSLNGILSASEMLLDEEELSQTRPTEYPPKRPSLERRATGLNAPSNLISLIDSSGRQLLQVINQLLQLDRTSTKLKPLSEITCVYDIEEEVLEAIMLATQRSKFKSVTLLSDTIMPASRSNIHIDSSFLGHVIVAVLQNAVDVTEKGIVRITFDLSSDSKFIINIKDSGPGIPEALRAQIFEPFFKINGFASTAGLGLTFAKIYTEALGGSITIESSSPAEGSLFRFQVPVECRATENKKRVHTPATNTTYFIEDDTIVTRHYAATLDRLGYASTTSLNARLIIQAEYRDQMEDSRPSTPTASESVRIRLVMGNHYRKKSTTLHKSERLIRCGLPLGHNKIIASLRLVRDNFDGAVSDDVEALITANTPAPSASLKSAGAAPFSMSLTNKRIGGQLRILNVDDNDINLRIIDSFCSKRKYPCVNARNGAEALERYIKAHQEGQPLTFVAMDFQMPVCNGAEATKKIRAYEKEQNMPRAFIYMITGQSGEEEKHLSMQAGCDAYWVKPLRVRTLDDTLATLFM